MTCPVCGHDIPAGASFCPRCGRKLDPAEIVPDDATTPAANEPPPGNDLPSESPRDRFARAGSAQSDRAVLSEDELWAGGYSPKAMVGTLVASSVITLGLLAVAIFAAKSAVWATVGVGIAVMWLALGAVLAYRRLSIHYRLTSQRFFQERGLLRRVTERIEVIDVDDITFEQGVFDRFLGTGTIHVRSSDQTDPVLEMPGIDNVAQVANLLDNARRAERRRRGLRIESI